MKFNRSSIMGIETTGSVKEIRDIVVEVGQFVTNFLGKDYQKFATKYNFILNDYLKAKLANLSKVKMAFFSSELVNLNEIYVEQNIRLHGALHSQKDFYKLLPELKKVVVSATAGSGKSCLMKSIFVNIIKSKENLLPLYIELRKVNETNQSIFETLRLDIATYNNIFDKDNLSYLLKREKTIIFLDGFDEVDHDLKNNYINELNTLAEIYPNLIIIVSSRPEYNEFKDWSLYNVAYIEPLSLLQAKHVIQKLHYDIEVKNRFISALQQDLFETKLSFSSNPLLLTIMLITYEQFGEIPDKMHIFYEFAYQALFNKHDISKQGFKRKMLTKLDIHDFKNVFSLFCLTTYCKELFEITENEFNKLLEKCILYFEYQTSYEDLKTDLLSNIPLVMRDGIEFCFTHRSFQEYFTANHLVNHEVKEEIFTQVCERFNTDSTVDMMFSMNKDLLERIWILPKIDKLLMLKPEYICNANDEVKLTEVFYHTIFNRFHEDLDEIYYIPNNDGVLVDYLVRKYNFQDVLDTLKYKYLSTVYKSEEKEFCKIVLEGKGDIQISSLEGVEAELFSKMKGAELAKVDFEVLEMLKDFILKSRESKERDIDSLIFG